jgi:hypothetical protein
MWWLCCCLQVIQRIGHWLLDSFGTAYIVPGFTPEALLALGFWPGAAQKDFTGYWAERFHVSVPSELVYLLMPGLDRLEEATTELDSKANGSRSSADREAANAAERLVQVLKMGAVVVVQDALELAKKFPDNPLHKALLEQPAFRSVLSMQCLGLGAGTRFVRVACSGTLERRLLTLSSRLLTSTSLALSTDMHIRLLHTYAAVQEAAGCLKCLQEHGGL